MPRYKLDQGYFEEEGIPFEPEMFAEAPKGVVFSDHPAEEVKVDFRELRDTRLTVYNALKEMGVTEVVCLYDGGFDEGFAHFERAIWPDRELDVKSLAAELAGGPLGGKPQTTFIWYSPAMEAQLTSADRAKDALDEFAYALAEQLLGGGFGTASPDMAGRLRFDLQSGLIRDELRDLSNGVFPKDEYGEKGDE
jgi:hypothetical protein